MRFNYEELYDTSGSQSESSDDENEYTIIGGDDEGVPQLKLPKPYPKGKPKEEEPIGLEPELQEMLLHLNLRSKLPQPSHNLFLSNIRYSTEPEEETFQLKNGRNDWDTIKNTSSGINSITRDIQRKLAMIEQGNEEQVNKVLLQKKQAEEEQKHRQEEERRRREEEEKLRCLEKERLLKEEQRKREEAEAERKRKEEEAEQQREAQQRLEEEKRKKREEEEMNNAQEAAKKSRGLTNFKEIELTFFKYKEKIKSIKSDIIEPVKNDKTLKSILSKHKRRINPKFGQLTNSNQQFQLIFNELSGLIDQTRPNNLGYQWILNFIAKALVSQAETEVRVKPESALPLAKLTLNLLVKYPELLELLMARFVKKCPIVIGFTCSIDSEEGRLRMGWKRNQDGKWEDEVSYDERMGGIATFYSVITRLPLSPVFITSHSHPLPISHSWQLLARIANTPIELLTNTHFVVIGSWWDAAAAEFLQAYGKQAQKLLVLISSQLTNAVADRKYVGAARLRILSEEWESTGTINSFPQMTT